MELSKRCLCVAVVQLLCALCAVESFPDGVNYYKDWLRGKNDEEMDAMIDDEPFEAPKLFFYRTPSSFTELGMGEPYNKRTVNKYKNMMLNKDNLDVPLIDDVEQTKEATRFFFPRITPKRSPGAILSWAIPAANRVRVVSTNYRPPGINRPAA
ncbi:uncharacterized protein LOC131288362 [Anopheles ziemanni]|uniref:uncharacterized protein LOC131259138 n=1 Tax=Anopheles coustani TaxID=139045 RepID=UPI00265AE210|nr:uncharacterized protein LOC131259138 [Anopheles coustani]XP_058173469.1 uncharacterized protein LOC131288362 [Anopheles ziemanni]